MTKLSDLPEFFYNPGIRVVCTTLIFRIKEEKYAIQNDFSVERKDKQV